MASSNGATDGQTQPQAQLNLQRIYIKDVSFEAPGAPQIFQEQGQPNVELNLSQRANVLGPDVYEVVLSVTATCKVGDKTAYLAEVQQAGIFGVAGFDDASHNAILGSYCPNALFPYVRQVISDLVQSGGFPPLFLQPINFDALYAEQMRRQAEGAGAQVANA